MIMVKKSTVNRQWKEVEITCPECNGHGGHDIAQICPRCNDSGKVVVRKYQKHSQS